MPSRSSLLPRAALLALCCLPLLASAGGKTYRWKDANGRVHYSDVPAPKSQELAVKTVSGTAVTPEQQAEREARVQTCQRKRDQLATYTAANTVTETDSLGNIKTYSDEEKAKLVARTQAEVNDACAPKTSKPE